MDRLQGMFLYALSRVESAAVPEQIVVSRIDFDSGAKLSHPTPGLPTVELGLDASLLEIANSTGKPLRRE